RTATSRTSPPTMGGTWRSPGATATSPRFSSVHGPFRLPKQVISGVILLSSVTSRRGRVMRPRLVRFGRTAMRRWDRLVEIYIEGYAARGINPASVQATRSRLVRWGQWLKQRRPRVSVEQIDADLITRYIQTSTTFRSKA